jgi:hypothetical protein
LGIAVVDSVVAEDEYEFSYMPALSLRIVGGRENRLRD